MCKPIAIVCHKKESYYKFLQSINEPLKTYKYKMVNNQRLTWNQYQCWRPIDDIMNLPDEDFYQILAVFEINNIKRDGA